MSVRKIDFETLRNMCKHRDEEDICSEPDNYSGECDCSECPVWNDLSNGDSEL